MDIPRVFFAHSQLCNDGRPHSESVVAELRSALDIEIVVKFIHESETPDDVRQFLVQFSDVSSDHDNILEDQVTVNGYTEWTKNTLVVVDMTKVRDPMATMTVINDHLHSVTPRFYFLVLQPLIPVGCAYCPCNDWFIPE